MKRPHIITMSGKPGSGKSSTSDQVAELLGYTRYSSGDFVRHLVKEQGITLEEFNRQAEADHTVDQKIDEELRKLREADDIVIDSRLGFYWIPESFKVYLDLDIDLATARIYRDSTIDKERIESGEGGSMADVIESVKERMESEQRRFRRLYGVDPYDKDDFDLIIDTTNQSPQSVALYVLDNYKKWLQSDEWQTVCVEAAEPKLCD